MTKNLEVCEEPVFVIGAPRSGTSMMQWSLRQHPDLWGGQESDYLVPLIKGARDAYDYGSVRGDLHWLSGQGVSWDEFLGHVGIGINSLYTNRSDGLIWVEQSPIYTLHLDDMKRLFPGARFVYMLRDGRSVVHSLRNFVNPMDHEQATRTWMDYTTAAFVFAESTHGASLLTVRYEDVVADTTSAVRRIHEFLGIPFAGASVEFIEAKNPINSSFSGETSGEKVGPRWASWTKAERRSFADSAGELMATAAYEQDDAWVGVGDI